MSSFNNGIHQGLFLRPDETTFGSPGGSPVTGFTTQWRVLVRPQFVCTNVANYQCNVAGATLHLVFSRQNDPSYIMKRSNGQPLSDIMVTLPQF